MRIVYNEQLYGIAHYIQCVTVLLIVYNVQNVLHTVDTEHEMLRIVYNAQTVQIEYDIYMYTHAHIHTHTNTHINS